MRPAEVDDGRQRAQDRGVEVRHLRVLELVCNSHDDEVLGMPDALTSDLLDELAARWRAIDAPVAHSLEPGLSEEAIDELGQSVSLWVPAEARTLWGCRNGADLNANAEEAGHTFGSLQQAIEGVEMMRRIAEEVADSYGPERTKRRSPATSGTGTGCRCAATTPEGCSSSTPAWARARARPRRSVTAQKTTAASRDQSPIRSVRSCATGSRSSTPAPST